MTLSRPSPARRAALVIGQALALAALTSCSAHRVASGLVADGTKPFRGFILEKVWEKEIYGRWCLACSGGVLCSELVDRGNKEYDYSLYDYSGSLIRKRRLSAGQGPDEIQAGNLDTVWLSPSGKISIADMGGYIKFMDPLTLSVHTAVRLSNTVPAYESRFEEGRISNTSWEEKGDKIVTTLESTGFYVDFTYYLVSLNAAFGDFRILATEKKAKPLSQRMLEESRRGGKDKLETVDDYYGRRRIARIFCVDWPRGVVYLFPDIERPEVEAIKLSGGPATRYSVNIDPGSFAIERGEFDFYSEYCSSQTPESLKRAIRSSLYLPAHAPALMGGMVVGDHLLLITGKRNWKKGENWTLVYRLPGLSYEGCFNLPYSNIQYTKWSEPYYISVDLVLKDEDYLSRYDIYKLTELTPVGAGR